MHSEAFPLNVHVSCYRDFSGQIWAVHLGLSYAYSWVNGSIWGSWEMDTGHCVGVCLCGHAIGRWLKEIPFWYKLEVHKVDSKI